MQKQTKSFDLILALGLTGCSKEQWIDGFLSGNKNAMVLSYDKFLFSLRNDMAADRDLEYEVADIIYENMWRFHNMYEKVNPFIIEGLPCDINTIERFVQISKDCKIFAFSGMLSDITVNNVRLARAGKPFYGEGLGFQYRAWNKLFESQAFNQMVLDYNIELQYIYIKEVERKKVSAQIM